MAVVINTRSPERAWPPFLEWLRAQGLDPADVNAIAIHDDGSAVAVVIRRTGGRPQIIDGELATRNHRIDQVSSAPPLHPFRRARQ